MSATVSYLGGADVWWTEFWTPENSTIVKCSDGEFAVLDHQIQTTVATCADKALLEKWFIAQGSKTIDSMMNDSSWGDF